MIIMPVKEGENIEKALKKFKRKYERTGASSSPVFHQTFGCEAYRHAACHLRREAAPRRGIGRFFHILILIIDKNFLSCLLFFCCFTAGCSLFFLQN